MATARTFHRLALITVVAVYLLILVGGVVRATGSGMGCPDWPKCFGRWVPPTDVTQLPADYQELYATEGHGVAEFNVAKTWTEYVNRLIGVMIGFLIFATMIAARRFLKIDPPVFWWSAVAFVLVGFQGWLGSVVVATNLATWMVTVHMLVALVIVGVLLYVVVRARREGAPAFESGWSRSDTWFAGVVGLSLAQVTLGTQVRERIDEIAASGAFPRSQWIAESGLVTLIHRSSSLLLVAACVALVWWLKRQVIAAGDARSWAGPQRSLARLTLATLALSFVAGVLLFYFALPPWLQPLHMLFASILAGALFALWLVGSEPAVNHGT